jgi:glutathione S-transferase
VRASVLEHGLEAPGIPEALRAHVTLLARMESTLASHDWLGGARPSLADAAALPYVLRLEHLALDALLSLERRPSVAAWYRRMLARPSFARAVARYLPEAAVGAMRRAGQAQAETLDLLTRQALDA